MAQEGGKVYLDDQGNPITGSGTYLDEQGNPKTAASQPAGLKTRSTLDTAKELGKGFIKSATRSVQAVADDLPHMFGGAGLGDYIDLISGRPQGTSAQMVREGAQNRNTPQMIGGLAETGTELGLPLVAGAQAMPRAGRAAQTFQDVMGAARTVPIDVNAPGQAALRIQELAERGGSMPMSARKFLNRITAPGSAPMNYEEGRDFASNISRLSADESNRLTPVVKREMGNLRTSLNASNEAAASSVGKGEQYRQAMEEYRKAMAVRSALQDMLEGAKRTLPFAGAGAAGYWLGHKVSSLFEP